MSTNNAVAFRFDSFKEWVPDKLRFWIYIFILLVFQLTGSIYFPSMPNMVGSLSISMNDAKMISHAMLIGITFYFPLAFRLKFRFTNRTNLLIAALGVAVCNLVIPQIESTPLLIILSFVCGFLRLLGTFECLSTLLPKIAPTHNYSVFLSFVFVTVLGVIHLFDILCVNIIYYYDWHHMHYLAIGLLLITVLIVFVLMRPFRFAPKIPLYGIDWLGMLLWSIFILSLIFAVQYGEQMDWLHSPFIRAAIGISTLSLAINIGRMIYIRHPFLEINAFRKRNLVNLLILFLFLGILLSVKNVLQNRFIGAVLQFDPLNTATLKWFEFAGALLGGIFSWYTLSRLKWSHKFLAFIGMLSVVIYIAISYFLITPHTNIEKLFLPLIFLEFGHIVVFVSLTVYAQATTPFRYYFQVICILGFIRTGIASPIGDAIYNRALTGLMTKHFAATDSAFNPSLMMSSMDIGSIITTVQVSAIKELYGWSVILGALILIAIALSRFKPHVSRRIPSLEQLYKVVSRK